METQLKLTRKTETPLFKNEGILMQKKKSHIEKLGGGDEVTQEMVWTNDYDDVLAAQKEKGFS